MRENYEYRMLRNQMVIMSTLRCLTNNKNIQAMLDDNIEPTADMLQDLSSSLEVDLEEEFEP